ncbi:MAG: hypothetical protein IJL63_08565 [Clostridia bacterium]|nr:hypothetical protein [Clostridia bacterium]
MGENKRIFAYIKENPWSTVDDISTALRLNGKVVLKSILLLQKHGYIKQGTPVPLEYSDEGSVFYSVSGKEYTDDIIGEYDE